MSFAGINGRYNLAVQAGSTIGPILRNPASIVGGTSAHTSPLITADPTNTARVRAITRKQICRGSIHSSRPPLLETTRSPTFIDTPLRRCWFHLCGELDCLL